ncbi:hypothetical protein [Marinimicrobium sp. C2-29]|uniref:hypothetical protein n=1 Tax=Marinimicrobium sp. C2-29 TaxID=3139825 RepID=UPI0031390F9E
MRDIKMLCVLSAMTKNEAIAKIENSIAEGSQLITPAGKTYEDHLAAVSKKLFDHVIEPMPALVTSTCVAGEDYEKYKNSSVLAIAQMGSSWLLTLEFENEFALGFGESPKDIMMHGFSSPDAIGEWCV